MDFSRTSPPPRGEPIVPMINVVFLLLVFFLMTAQITPPDPFEVTAPTGAGADAVTGDTPLFVGAEGQMAYADARGQDVFAALAARPRGAPLPVRIDAAAPAVVLARLTPQLASLGIDRIALEVSPK